jgi:drug/metabolite transporter (DMT)-like permease
MQERNVVWGILFGVSSACLFGLSGVIAQPFLSAKVFSPWQLTTLRLLVGGIVLGILRLGIAPRKFMALFKNWRSIGQVILFGIFGLFFAQTSFFTSEWLSSAAVATILQSLAPAVLLGIQVIFHRRRIVWQQFLGVLLAVLGVSLIVMRNIGTTGVRPLAVIFGLLAAVGVICYTLLPATLLLTYHATDILSWGMIFGGLVSLLLTRQPFRNVNSLNVSAVLIIVLLGTVLAYALYLVSLQYIDHLMATLTGLFEPVSSTLISLIVFRNQLTVATVVGILIILVSIILISLRPTPHDKSKGCTCMMIETAK